MMKLKNKIFLVINVVLLVVKLGNSQINTNIQMPTSINENGLAPNPSAILEVQSDNKGMLIPRMDMITRDNVSNPATGLLIYQNDNTPGFYYFNGFNWVGIANNALDADTDSNNELINAITLNNSELILSEGGAIHIVDLADLIEDNDSDPNNEIELPFGGTEGQVLSVDNIGEPQWINNIATTGEANVLTDDDNDTKIYVQKYVDEDVIRIDLGGAEYYRMINGRLELGRSNNTFIGNNAGENTLIDGTSLGNANTFLGNKTGYSNVTGTSNCALGSYALHDNINGGGNVAIGNNTLQQNTTGFANTSVGSYTLRNNNGYHNTACGYSALNTNSQGISNTAIGVQSLEINTTGDSNTAIGKNTLNNCTTGSNNTALGTEADIATGNQNNSTTIGYQAMASSDNEVRLGNSNVTSIGGYANWTNVSDVRFKDNIREEVHGLDFIQQLRPVTYELNRNKIKAFLGFNVEKSTDASSLTRQSGFIAQEVEQTAKNLGFEFSGVDAPQNENAHYGLKYAEFVVPLVKGMQEQQEMIEELKKENENLKLQIDLLLNKVQAIEQAIKTD